jgi:nucleoside-diphosphate kinase|tara:strand:- start:31 stop:567 length:537 start_codon:yes stop_codon:yes gene_type:complete
MTEKTLVLIKPDGVQKNLNGQIISRFESSGLKIRAMKMVQASEELTKKHYPLDEEWAKNLYNKTKASYDSKNKPMEFSNHLDLGKSIQSRLQLFLQEGPVTALVLEGENAISKVREIAGATEPSSALPGTIRKDFAPEETYTKADSENRAVKNLVHASDAPETAQREISVWFSPEEIH